MDNYVTGTAIRTLREKQHLTQAQLAEQINVSDKAAGGTASYFRPHDQQMGAGAFP